MDDVALRFVPEGPLPNPVLSRQRLSVLLALAGSDRPVPGGCENVAEPKAPPAANVVLAIVGAPVVELYVASTYLIGAALACVHAISRPANNSSTRIKAGFFFIRRFLEVRKIRGDDCD